MCPELTNYILKHREKWTKEFKNAPDLERIPEVLYFEHGLRFASQNLKKYIANKAFFDIGAYCGESIYVLAKHKPSKIYSYEISRQSIQKILYNVKRYGLENVAVVNHK